MEFTVEPLYFPYKACQFLLIGFYVRVIFTVETSSKITLPACFSFKACVVGDCPFKLVYVYGMLRNIKIIYTGGGRHEGTYPTDRRPFNGRGRNG